jgi:hypothetical protein
MMDESTTHQMGPASRTFSRTFCPAWQTRKSRQISRHIGGTPHSYVPSGAAKPACIGHLVTVAALSQIGREILFKRKPAKTDLANLNPSFSMNYLFKRKPELAASKKNVPDNWSSTPTENPQKPPRAAATCEDFLQVRPEVSELKKLPKFKKATNNCLTHDLTYG